MNKLRNGMMQATARQTNNDDDVQISMTMIMYSCNLWPLTDLILHTGSKKVVEKR